MADDREPDPRLVWRWAGQALRPALGWVLTGVGAAALVAGYIGVATEVVVARQLPYVVSGGLGGIGLVFLGGIYLGAQDVRRSTDTADLARRLVRLERLVGELHAVLLQQADAAPGPLPDRDGAGAYALPAGSTYHRPDCVVLEGKQPERTSRDEAERRGLTPCKLCEPAAFLNA